MFKFLVISCELSTPTILCPKPGFTHHKSPNDRFECGEENGKDLGAQMIMEQPIERPSSLCLWSLPNLHPFLSPFSVLQKTVSSAPFTSSAVTLRATPGRHQRQRLSPCSVESLTLPIPINIGMPQCRIRKTIVMTHAWMVQYQHFQCREVPSTFPRPQPIPPDIYRVIDFENRLGWVLSSQEGTGKNKEQSDYRKCRNNRFFREN